MTDPTSPKPDFVPCGREVSFIEMHLAWSGTCKVGHMCPHCRRIAELLAETIHIRDLKWEEARQAKAKLADQLALGNVMAVHACASRAYERSDKLADAIDAWEAARAEEGNSDG